MSNIFTRDAAHGQRMTVISVEKIFFPQTMLNYYNSNFTNFLYSDWLFGRLYTSIKAMRKKVQVGKDQEKAQSEKDSHSKNQGGEKNKLTIRHLYHENIS